MIILSTPTSLPPAFQPFPASDTLPPFPWAAFAELQLHRDTAPSQAGPSTSTSLRGDRPNRVRKSTNGDTTPVDALHTVSDQESEPDQSDTDPDYKPEDQPPSPPKPLSRSRSQSRAAGTPVPEKRYTCEEPLCGKSFSKPAKLKEHLLGHTGEVSVPPSSRSRSHHEEPIILTTKYTPQRPFKCPHPSCTASYTRLSHLQRHTLTHKNPSEKQFTCAWKGVDGREGRTCGKRFWTKEKLGRHERGHLVESEGKREGKGKKFDVSFDLGFYLTLLRPQYTLRRMLIPLSTLISYRRTQCPHCPETFHKHIKLRSHVLDTHRDALLAESREGTPKRVFKKRLTPFSPRKTGENDQDGDGSGDEYEMEQGEEQEEDVKGRIRPEDEPRYRPFRCEVHGCGWTFETAQRLKMHGKLHQGRSHRPRSPYRRELVTDQNMGCRATMAVTAKRYICSHQDHADDLPSFSRWSDLQGHIKTDHPPVCPYEACHVSHSSRIRQPSYVPQAHVLG